MEREHQEPTQLPGLDTSTAAPGANKPSAITSGGHGDNPGQIDRLGSARLRPLADYPELMTVKESAAYLRIGVSTCYELTKRYADTHGQRGIPAVKVGGRTFVIRDRLARYLHGDAS